MDRPGVVDLRDLLHRYMWSDRAIAPFIAATGLEVAQQPAWRAFTPPRVLVLVVHDEDARLLERSRPWLEECEHLVVVRDCREGATGGDPELVALIAEEWKAALAGLDHAVFDWSGDPAPCRAALAHAVARASRLEPSAASEPPPNPDIELPMSSWMPWTGTRYLRLGELFAPRLALRDGRPVIIDVHGAAHDLSAPRTPIELGLAAHIAPLPLAANARDPAAHHPGLRARGVDPIHPIAWRGHRMAVYWSYVGAREVGFLSATDHDYPCGPSKKLWGYDDNEPITVALTPSADACAQIFEHDVLLIRNVPVGWHRAGAVDVAAFVRDPRRAAFYAQTAEFVSERATDDLEDEDNRELAPVLILGPHDACRYAVDLRHRVVRIGSGGAEIIGGPNEGFAVFDADHRLVRRGEGVLLGGWFRFATVEHAGWLWREDLVTGARKSLGSAARLACVDPDVEAVVLDAIHEGRHDAAAALRAEHPTRSISGDLEVVAVPGTRNIIEIGSDVWRVV